MAASRVLVTLRQRVREWRLFIVAARTNNRFADIYRSFYGVGVSPCDTTTTTTTTTTISKIVIE